MFEFVLNMIDFVLKMLDLHSDPAALAELRWLTGKMLAIAASADSTGGWGFTAYFLLFGRFLIILIILIILVIRPLSCHVFTQNRGILKDFG